LPRDQQHRHFEPRSSTLTATQVELTEGPTSPNLALCSLNSYRCEGPTASERILPNPTSCLSAARTRRVRQLVYTRRAAFGARCVVGAHVRRSDVATYRMLGLLRTQEDMRIANALLVASCVEPSGAVCRRTPGCGVPSSILGSAPCNIGQQFRSRSSLCERIHFARTNLQIGTPRNRGGSRGNLRGSSRPHRPYAG
jgi:hypothetical protein